MAKGKRKRRRPGHAPGPAVSGGEAVLTDLEAKVRELTEADPVTAGPIWGAAHKLLLKTDAEPAVAARVVTTRDVGALGRLLRTLRGEEIAEEPAAIPDAPVPDVPAETLKKAMRAFRKRLKLVRLDHESRLGVGPMTSGRKADFDAILPPQEFPAEVWEALDASGQLRAAGQGFYMLADEDRA